MEAKKTFLDICTYLWKKEIKYKKHINNNLWFDNMEEENLEKRITVRLPEKLHKKVEEGISESFCKNKSEYIRNSLEKELEEQGIIEPSSIEYDLYLSNELLRDMEKVIEMGYAVDVGDLVRHSLREYIEKNKNQTKLDDYTAV